MKLCDVNQDGKVEFQEYEYFVVKSLERSGLNLYDWSNSRIKYNKILSIDYKLVCIWKIISVLTNLSQFVVYNDGKI
jgi:hypothetical protein